MASAESTECRGSYSQVATAMDLERKEKVAVKIIDLLSKDATKEYLTKFLPREVEIIKMVDHVNIMKTYKVIDSIKDKMIFVTEFCPKGDVLKKLKTDGPYLEADAQVTFRQLMEAMIYLQSKDIVHRDMKCENLFLDAGENIKVGDFGFARYMKPNDTSKTFCGSRVYVAPEVLLATPYSGYTTDIWSCGIVLYVMLIAAMPFSDKDPEEMVVKMQTHKIPFPDEDEISTKAKALLIDMMHPNPASRPSYKKICENDWLKGTAYQMRPAAIDGADKPPADRTQATLPSSGVTNATVEKYVKREKEKKKSSGLKVKLATSIKSFKSRIKRQKKNSADVLAVNRPPSMRGTAPTSSNATAAMTPATTDKPSDGTARLTTVKGTSQSQNLSKRREQRSTRSRRNVKSTR